MRLQKRHSQSSEKFTTSTSQCGSACNFGSDSYLVVLSLTGTDDAGLEKIEVPTAIHLAFDELELRDLPLGLAVRPG